MSTGLDPAISSVLSAQQTALRNQIAMGVEAKRLDAVKLQGDAAVQMIEAAAGVQKSASKGQGLGTFFDSFA